MTPPEICALSPSQLPNRLPTNTAVSEHTKVVAPMRRTVGRIWTRMALEAHPNGKGVDAGGNGLKENREPGEPATYAFLLFAKAVIDHFAADNA